MEQVTQILKALADENRLMILRLSLQQDLCVSGLSKRIGISNAAVSQHLKILREANLITGEKRGYFTHYHTNCDVLKSAANYLKKMAQAQTEELPCDQANAPCKCPEQDK